MANAPRDPRAPSQAGRAPSGGSVYGGGRPGSSGGKSGRPPASRAGKSGQRPGTKSGGSKSRSGAAGPKPKSPIWTKILIAFGSLVLLGSLVGLVAVPTLVHQLAGSIDTQNLLGDQAAGASIDGSINMLLVGLDTRPNDTIGSRSDSIIIAHIPKDHQGVYLVSIPRDTDAAIPADPATGFGGGHAKINAAFLYGSWHKGGASGGFQLLAKTIKQNYDISFNGGAIVNFDGFTDIVNKLGGVNMNVDELTTSIHHGYIDGDRNKHAAPFKINPSTGVPICPRGYSFNKTPLKCALPGVTPVQYKPGFQHLSAYDALDYVRCRDGLPYTDYDRQRHQQQFMKALLKDAYNQGMSNPTKLKSFLDSISKAFIFDHGSSSVTDWIFTLKSINPSSIVTIKTNDGKYVKYTGPAPDERQALSADSMQLLQDVKTDNVNTFVETHSDWVANS